MEQPKKEKKIELRSEQIRNIIGKPPSPLLRTGIFISCISLLLLFFIAWILPYRQEQSVQIEWYTEPPMQFTTMPTDGYFHTTTRSKNVQKGDYIGYITSETDSIRYLYAQTEGKINFYLPDKHRAIAGEVLFTILPDTIRSLYGIARLSATEILKLCPGQKVISYYPTAEEKITGYISGISPLPRTDLADGTDLYRVEITFDYQFQAGKGVVPSLKSNGSIVLREYPVLHYFLPIMKRD